MSMADYDLSDLAAVVANRNGDGSGMFSNGEGLLWLLFILILGWGNGGWNRGGGNGGGAGAGNVGGNELYPWMTLQQQFTEILQALCNGLAGVSSAIATGFAQAETSAANRAMNAQQNMFGLQTAMMQGFNAQQAQLSDCCCKQQLATAQLGSQIAADGCATRQVVNESSRDIMQNDNANYQRIMDKLCQLELDGVKAQLAQAESEKAQLREELSTARFQASQAAQNQLITQGFSNEVDALYNRLNACPVPTTPVYGRTPIFTCQGNACQCNN